MKTPSTKLTATEKNRRISEGVKLSWNWAVGFRRTILLRKRARILRAIRLIDIRIRKLEGKR